MSAADTKFVVRFTDCSEMHEQAKTAAKSSHISLNSFILQAIDEKLNRGAAMDRLLGMAETCINTTVINVVGQDPWTLKGKQENMNDDAWRNGCMIYYPCTGPRNVGHTLTR